MTENAKTFLIVVATIAIILIVRFVPSPPPTTEEYTIPPDPVDVYGSY